MKFDTVLCNPPYNTGDNDTPIYHLFLEKFSDASDSIWIIPSSWTGNPSWSVSKSVRSNFLKSGAFYIVKNENDVFVTAQVRTSSAVCSSVHKGGWEWVDRESGKKVFKEKSDLLKNKILFSWDQKEIEFIERMKQHSEGKMKWFDDNPKTWKIGVFHINRDKSKNQLGGIRVMDPSLFSSKHANKYLKLWECETEEEAMEILPKIESFWNSTLIQYLLSRVWHTYTIQRSTFEWTPAPNYSRVWTEEEILDFYEVTEQERNFLHEGQ